MDNPSIEAIPDERATYELLVLALRRDCPRLSTLTRGQEPQWERYKPRGAWHSTLRAHVIGGAVAWTIVRPTGPCSMDVWTGSQVYPDAAPPPVPPEVVAWVDDLP